MPPKKKCRQYLVEYLKFGFIPSPSNEQLPMCLLCNSVFSNEAMKPSRLQEHLNKKHPDKANADIAYFQGLKDRHANRKTIKSLFDRSTVVSERGLKASYAISLLIARTGFGLVWFRGLTPQQQPGSYQGGEMMMKSVFWWRKPEHPEETTDLRQVTDETFSHIR